MNRVLGLSVLLLGALLAGCIGTEDDQGVEPQSTDDLDDVTWGQPIPEVIEALEHTSHLDAADASGAGIWTHGDHAYVSGLSSGFHVVDISQPDDPTVVGNISGEEVYSRDADLITYPNQTVVVLATQSGGMTFVDVTDPTDPEILSILEIEPNHNVAVVPGTHIVYNSPSTGQGRSNEIVDASDPRTPEIIGEFGEYGCHDISFYTDQSEDKHRAYCAGVDIAQVWDIADPTQPEHISDVSNPCMDDTVEQAPRSNCGGLHHSAFVNEDASILLLGDEFQGGAGPGCGAHAGAEGTSVSSPVGAVWFYDITDEEAPELLGWYAPTVPLENHVGAVTNTVMDNPTAAPFSASCTSHFGEIVPGKEMVVMGWYDAGVVLVDFSDPGNPVQVDQWNQGTTVWDARIHNGYIFTGDISRGLDVLTFVG